MTLKRIILKRSLVIVLIIGLLLTSCDKDDNPSGIEDLEGNWTKLGLYEGMSRGGAVSFVIDNVAYIGLGYNVPEKYFLNDFWKYDYQQDSWEEIDSFPGARRADAVAFSLNGKGYVGTGYSCDDPDSLENKTLYKDFYQYDPATNKWSRISDITVSSRYGATAFQIGDYGYVGSGHNEEDSSTRDFYKYNPGTDTWSQITSMWGHKKSSATSFVINNIAYVVSGYNDGGYYTYDFYKYDPTIDNWTELRRIADFSADTYDDKYTSIIRHGAVSFTINGKGYIATGSMGNEVWEYDPINDLWIERTGFEGIKRENAVSFTINNVPYVACGSYSKFCFDDVWSFDPTAEQDDADNY